MGPETIARINALAHKAKTEGLTPEETTERDRLRREYIASVKANLVGQLDNTYVIGIDGIKRKLQHKAGELDDVLREQSKKEE